VMEDAVPIAMLTLAMAVAGGFAESVT
jgi:hypothetical protein